MHQQVVLLRWSRVFLGGMWLLSASAKLWFPDTAVNAVLDIGASGQTSAKVVAGVIALEMLCGLVLLVSRATWVVLFCSCCGLGMMAGHWLFTRNMPESSDCGCWGRLGGHSGVLTVLLIGVPSVMVIVSHWTSKVAFGRASWLRLGLAIISSACVYATGLQLIGKTMGVDAIGSEVSDAVRSAVQESHGVVDGDWIIVGTPRCGKCRALASGVAGRCYLLIAEAEEGGTMRVGNCWLVYVRPLVWRYLAGRDIPTVYMWDDGRMKLIAGSAGGQVRGH